MTTTVDPQSVIVAASIDFHTAIKAIQEYADKYPIDRVSVDQAKAVTAAGRLLHKRLEESGRFNKVEPLLPEPGVVWQFTCPIVSIPHDGCLHPDRVKVA